MKILAVLRNEKIVGWVRASQVEGKTFVATDQFTLGGSPVNFIQFRVSKNRKFVKIAEEHPTEFYTRHTPDGPCMTWLIHANESFIERAFTIDELRGTE